MTDGCLSSNKKTVTQVSKDRDLLETFKRCVGSDAPIRWNQHAFRVQVCDVAFYRWLESIGLMRRKSLVVGPIAVPDNVFAHFVRGLLDGDGSILFSIVIPNPRRYPLHSYPRLRVQFLSASRDHIEWLTSRIKDLYGLEGWTTTRYQAQRAPLHILRFSKHEAIQLLSRLYADPTAPRLERKWGVWNAFLSARPTRMWTRRSDETGKHSGLKHPWAQALEGSNPSSGTDVERPARASSIA